MRWVALALVASVAFVAQAGPEAPPAPRVTWADWVGDWQGKLRWSGCTLDGEPAASLAIDAVDGAVAIDLSAAGGALGTVPLVADASGWHGRVGDVGVRLAGGSAALELAVELDSGCAIRGALRRTSVGIAACDELAAWARVEDRCTQLVRPALENFARVAHQRAQWSQAPAEARGKLATQCKARASKVESELALAGCAPDPTPATPAAPARFPACSVLRLAAVKLTRCQLVPFDVATSLAHDANALADATAGIDSESSRLVLEKQCSAMRDRLGQTAQQAGCHL